MESRIRKWKVPSHVKAAGHCAGISVGGEGMGQTLSFIDAHCHLSDPRIREESHVLIARAKAAGVTAVMIGGLSSEEWRVQSELKADFPDFIRTSYGVHPWWVEKGAPDDLEREWSALKDEIERADAIGETGLDFHQKRDSSRFPLQIEFFSRHLRLASKTRKPLVLHVVDAQAEAIHQVTSVNPDVPILLHSFSGGPADVSAWIKLGAYLSFSGAILKEPGFKKVKEALKVTPLDRVLFETDAPDQGWRECRNEPSLISEVYEAGAKLLKVPILELTEKVAENFSKIR